MLVLRLHELHVAIELLSGAIANGLGLRVRHTRRDTLVSSPNYYLLWCFLNLIVKLVSFLWIFIWSSNMRNLSFELRLNNRCLIIVFFEQILVITCLDPLIELQIAQRLRACVTNAAQVKFYRLFRLLNGRLFMIRHVWWLRCIEAIWIRNWYFYLLFLLIFTFVFNWELLIAVFSRWRFLKFLRATALNQAGVLFERSDVLEVRLASFLGCLRR